MFALRNKIAAHSTQSPEPSPVYDVWNMHKLA